ncbi:MAG: hypothetical protein IJ759_03785 [Bacteroidales bacterium]|nr:hypothetical protein [Bacteroidales bacterium]
MQPDTSLSPAITITEVLVRPVIDYAVTLPLNATVAMIIANNFTNFFCFTVLSC